jgi:hypothetical protein
MRFYRHLTCKFRAKSEHKIIKTACSGKNLYLERRQICNCIMCTHISELRCLLPVCCVHCGGPCAKGHFIHAWALWTQSSSSSSELVSAPTLIRSTLKRGIRLCLLLLDLSDF